MKRILCITLALLLLFPILLLPTAAAEPEEYVFEYVEPVALMSDDYDYVLDGRYFYHYDLIPSGYYRVSFVYDGEIFLTPAYYFDFPERDNIKSLKLDIHFGAWDDELLPFYFSSVDSGLNFFGGYSGPYSVPYIGLGFIVFYNDGSYGHESSFCYSNISDVKMISYDPVAEGLVGSFHEDPHAAFSNILSILPIVIPVLVSFIGIRKAISYVRSKANGS